MKSINATVITTCLSLVVTHAASALTYCDNAVTRPTRLTYWSGLPSLQYDVETDGEYVFISVPGSTPPDYGAIHRYRINGAEHVVWPYATTGIIEASDLAINPLTGDLYVANFTTDNAVHVFDVDGNGVPKNMLFGQPPDPSPGSLVEGGNLIAIHPLTGDLYVVDQGWYDQGGEDETWISRIQRFHANGAFDATFSIGNNNPYTPHDLPEYESGDYPSCGTWHYPAGIMVDKDSNVYLLDRVNFAGAFLVVHKFGATMQCDALWNVTNMQQFRVDPDGFIYSSPTGSNFITKWLPDYQTKVYGGSGTLGALGPVQRIRFVAKGASQDEDVTEFLLVESQVSGPSDLRLEFLGAHVEPLNILNNNKWQDAQTGLLRTTDLSALTQCDSVMSGVVADGVSPLFLRWKVPGPGKVEWSISDPNAPEVESLLGTLATYDQSVVDPTTIETTVEEVDGASYAFAIYTAPMDFDRSEVPSDANAGVRLVTIRARFLPNEQAPDLTTTVTIDVRRPPLLLIHGWASEPTTWRGDVKAFADDPRWKVHYLDYQRDHGKGLEYHLGQGTISAGVITTRSALPGIVVAQVDAIMHSLGGLHVRKYADSPEYRGTGNAMKGDFHKLLFLDTPHYGSAFADFAIALRSVIGVPLIASNIKYEAGKRVATDAIVKGFATMSGSTKEEIIFGDAIDDLAPSSQALGALGELDVPAHLHVGNASGFWSLFPIDQVAIAATFTTAALALASEAFFTIPGTWPLFVSPSDLVVLTESQKGGVQSGQFTTVTDPLDGMHWNVTGSEDAADLAADWIHHRVDDTAFFAPSMPSPAAVPPTPMATMSLQDDYDLAPSFAGRTLSIGVTTPPSGTTVFPGQVVHFQVTDSPLSGVGLFGSDTVALFYPGGAYIREFQYFGNVLVTIPLDYVGSFELVAVGRLSDGRIVSSAPLTLNVSPGAKSPPAIVQSLRVEPSRLVLSGPGASMQLQVFADYTDGVERMVASGAGTTYAPNHASWHVTADGIVVGKAPGSGYITVTNSGQSVDIPVTVLNGPQINNAPHANAGGSYAACDSQFVSLNASASYDLDEVLGESLTYAWDLDADGEFDDVTGKTPFVKLVFPGAYWMLGLKVTDSHGLESIDYAFLEAAPGCLDGDFDCARTRGEAAAFFGDAFVGVDASGNIYVAEQIGDNNRIVKFSSSCDSIATFPITNELNKIFVTADGTTYISDSSPKRIWKYTSGGAESFVSIPDYLPRIAVDASGHIYGNDNSATGLVRKFNANGTANTTWNVGASFPIWDIAVGPDEEIYVASSNRIARGVLQGGNYALDWMTGQAGVDAAWESRGEWRLFLSSDGRFLPRDAQDGAVALDLRRIGFL